MNQLTDAEKTIKILQEENKKLKEKIEKKKKTKYTHEKYTDESNKLGYDKKYEISIKNDDDNNNIINDKKISEKTNSNFSENDTNNKNKENEGEEVEDEEYEESDSLINDLRDELENTKIELDKIMNEYKFLENKFNVLRENISNLLIKMKISKKYKVDIIEILKLLEFSENEIIFIVDKKKLY